MPIAFPDVQETPLSVETCATGADTPEGTATITPVLAMMLMRAFVSGLVEAVHVSPSAEYAVAELALFGMVQKTYPFQQMYVQATEDGSTADCTVHVIPSVEVETLFPPDRGETNSPLPSEAIPA